MTSGQEPTFNWDKIQRKQDGSVLLLYRHERMWDEGLIPSTDSWVLDVGGWGHLATRLRDEGVLCIILDAFTEDQHYPDRVKGLHYVNSNIQDIPIRTPFHERFMLVTCFEMLEHCTAQRQAVENMVMLLSPGGWLVGTVPVPGYCHEEGEPGILFLDEGDILELLLDYGLTDIMIEKTPSISKDDPRLSSIYFKGMKPHE